MKKSLIRLFGTLFILFVFIGCGGEAEAVPIENMDSDQIKSKHALEIRCNNGNCSSFGKVVSSSHKHNHKCNNGGCSAFGDYVSSSHKCG